MATNPIDHWASLSDEDIKGAVLHKVEQMEPRMDDYRGARDMLRKVLLMKERLPTIVDPRLRAAWTEALDHGEKTAQRLIMLSEPQTRNAFRASLRQVEERINRDTRNAQLIPDLV